LRDVALKDLMDVTMPHNLPEEEGVTSSGVLKLKWPEQRDPRPEGWERHLHGYKTYGKVACRVADEIPVAVPVENAEPARRLLAPP
jgi:hypothetical protein